MRELSDTVTLCQKSFFSVFIVSPFRALFTPLPLIIKIKNISVLYGNKILSI